MATAIAGGVVHTMPADLKSAIVSNKAVLSLWEDITPLARNEWICWVTSGKKAETRDMRINKAISKMKGGMRRPCCWIGCIHRTDKKISRSVQYVLDRKTSVKK